MVPLAARPGSRWMATGRVDPGADARARRSRATAARSPRAAGAPLRAVSRRAPAASDRVRVPRSRAVGPDRLHLRRAGRRMRPPTTSSAAWSKPAGASASARGGEDALIPIILDGENAWEHFAGGGRPFLRALYRAPRSAPRASTTVTMAEGCARARDRPLHDASFPGPGSTRNFYIWIGHADDQQAWSQLVGRPSRAATPRVADVHAMSARGARGGADRGRQRLVLVARRRPFVRARRRVRRAVSAGTCRNAYQLMGQQVPDELFVSNISAARGTAANRPPHRS